VANATSCLTGSPYEPSRTARGRGNRALQAIIKSPSETLIATGFDGTLAPIVDDPEKAYADPGAVAAFGWHGEWVGAVVVITARPARTVVRLGRFGEAAGLGLMIVLGQYGGALEYRGRPMPDPAGSAADHHGQDGAASTPGLTWPGRRQDRGQVALTEVSDVIVDGPAGLTAWLNALAERLEGRA
jgi:hypothetical protein